MNKGDLVMIYETPDGFEVLACEGVAEAVKASAWCRQPVYLANIVGSVDAKGGSDE